MANPKTVLYDVARDRYYIVGAYEDGRRFRTYGPPGNDGRVAIGSPWQFSGKHYVSGLGPGARWYELKRLDTRLNEPQAWGYEPCEPKGGRQQREAEEAEKLADVAAYSVEPWVAPSYAMDKYPNYIADHLRRQNAILGANMSPRMSPPHRLGSVPTGCVPLTEGQQIAELWKLVDQKNQQLKDERTALHNRVAECRALRSELRLMRRVMRLKAEVAAENCEFDCKAKGSHRSCPIHGERAP